MSLTGDVYLAFCCKLEAYADDHSPVLPVSYPNLNFVPPATGNWLEVNPVLNGSENYGMSNDATAVEMGFFIVNVYAQRGESTVAAQEIAEEVADLFAKGTELALARVEVPPSLAGSVQTDVNAFFPVTVRWRASRS